MQIICTSLQTDHHASTSLWPPYVIGQAIILLPCSFFLLLSFFSLPILSGCRLDVYHTSTHGVALVRIYNACLKCAARGSLEIQDAKNRHFGTIAQLCRFISSELCSVTARHCSSCRQPNFATLNRGRHLYSAGRPSRWAFAHILVTHFLPAGWSF